ncbi:MAG: insulinase family protein [Bacteroidales bacterium]|jgi:predicted Zn-dependent peptidase|nr:insulinase family protein [Bacteroidales bacterium]
MKKSFLLALLGLLVIATQAQQTAYIPIDVEVYQLKNGLTVILNEDHNLPQVFGNIMVRAGGKDDPKDATGMAHYMEHMLFKGTQELGTINWEAEKPHIDSIFRLYDKLGKETDPEIRKNIQKNINEESLKAAEYAVPNEMFNLLRSMGGTSVNADTSADYTIFLQCLSTHTDGEMAGFVQPPLRESGIPFLPGRIGGGLRGEKYVFRHVYIYDD